MAKLRSLIKIEGTLDDLTFYKGKTGYLVRTKGGIPKNRIMHDPAFKRTRENGMEFGNAATSGKQFRRAALPLLSDVTDNTITPRLTQQMILVKNQDLTSERGERKVAIGILTPQGQELLKGFECNQRSILSTVLLAEFELTASTGNVEIVDFVPNRDVAYPSGATHLSLESAVMRLNFETNVTAINVSPVTNLPIDNTVATVNLTPPGIPTGTGTVFYFLKIAFFQQVNGIQYELNNGAFNAVKIIEVI